MRSSKDGFGYETYFCEGRTIDGTACTNSSQFKHVVEACEAKHNCRHPLPNRHMVSARVEEAAGNKILILDAVKACEYCEQFIETATYPIAFQELAEPLFKWMKLQKEKVACILKKHTMTEQQEDLIHPSRAQSPGTSSEHVKTAVEL